MDYAFDHAEHDRAAHLRKDDAWRNEPVRVMVIGGEHVATLGGQGIRWISLDEAPDGMWIYLGTKNGVHHAAVVVGGRVPTELDPVSLRVLGPSIAPDDASLAVHAIGISRWHETHGFCAKCGALTDAADAGHTRVCPDCGAHHFPRTDPAVIMLRFEIAEAEVWVSDPSIKGRFKMLTGMEVKPSEAGKHAVGLV